MFQRLFRAAALATLALLLVPLAMVVADVAAGATAPKTVGAAAVAGLVAVVLLLIAAMGSRRPGLVMSATGAGGVMLFAASTAYTGLRAILLVATAIAMFGLCLWAAVSLVDRKRDEPVSHL